MRKWNISEFPGLFNKKIYYMISANIINKTLRIIQY